MNQPKLQVTSGLRRKQRKVRENPVKELGDYFSTLGFNLSEGCPQCKKKFPNQTLFLHHLCRHWRHAIERQYLKATGTTTFPAGGECRLCGKEIPRDLLRHVGFKHRFLLGAVKANSSRNDTRQSSKPKYPCPVESCGKSYCTRLQTAEHFALTHRDAEILKKYFDVVSAPGMTMKDLLAQQSCRICFAHVKTRNGKHSGLKRHLYRVHKICKQ